MKEFDSYSIIGRDASENYNLYKITLGNSDKPCIFLTASMHGNEWHSTQYALAFFENLRDNTYPDKELRNILLDNFYLVLIPVVNPYGLVISRGNEYARYNNPARHNANDVNINRDFHTASQPETQAVIKQLLLDKPFAYLDLHLFQPVYAQSLGNNLIIGNGQAETNEVRNDFINRLEESVKQVITPWNEPSINGLSRYFVANQSNDYTPYTLSYISEIVRPAYINDDLIEPLNKSQIFDCGIATIHYFLITSIEYFNKHN
ncbi:M14 family zinc carboxypeptidase [Oceanobacillus sp. ISL-74]|uniref:M14 family zinc carboxypeptidase n=1 Tax=Oceanobacillus sp. ISL-74 TaxID=2819162 RepID=UPI00333564FF